jgi:hypothetical protein
MASDLHLSCNGFGLWDSWEEDDRSLCLVDRLGRAGRTVSGAPVLGDGFDMARER